METIDVASEHPEGDTRRMTPDLPDLSDRRMSSPPYETIATVPLNRNRESPTQYETVATLPLSSPVLPKNPNMSRYTQPTQLIQRRSSPDLPTSPPPVVQVVASSPMTASVQRPTGILASAMAPAGTSFRRPFVPPRPAAKVITIDSDDDGPAYNGGSSESDREVLKRNDIKASNFFRPSKETATEKVPESPEVSSGLGKFQSITASSFYKPAPPGSTAIKRSSDSMANAYGSVSKRPRQVGPARAQPVENEPQDMDLDDIMDPNMRNKTKRLWSVFTSDTIRSCYEALRVKKGNYDDASDYLLLMSAKKTEKSEKPKTVDLTGSEDELLMTPAPKPASKTSINLSRQQAKKPALSIHEKWSSTQILNKPKPKQLTVFQEPTKKKGKLIRGRRDRSSPAASSPKAEEKVAITIDSDSDEADSGIHSSAEDSSSDSRLLSFFNTCSASDLADTAGISLDVASHLISQRPFKSPDAIRKVEGADSKPGKSKRKPIPLGEKILEKCDDMLQSYDAVDYLVKKCESIAKPLAEDMKGWGVNIYGAKDGELDMTSLKDSQRSGHDSGIGTPVSDVGVERPKNLAKHSPAFIPSPSIMSDEIQMKDYQVVGINWLALLFRKNLSCILADDMGLGKTCQVIAFLAHLLEIGEKGPHLVVVPAATLENWLQEFHRFCPTLEVEPYYASNPSEREEIRYHIDTERHHINVVVTTYTVAKSKYDFPWLKHFGFCCTIFDEGHYLKNAESQVARKLVKIESQFRLLLTGTPLQNNLKELISLLAFLMPHMFQEKEEQLKSIFTHHVKAMDVNHEALLSAQRVARARSMLTPFILRRKKYQVLKDLPKKERRVVSCEMTAQQAEIYHSYLQKALEIRRRRADGEIVFNESSNILMRLRQAAIHPLLFRRYYRDKELPKIAKSCLRDAQFAESNPALIVEELHAYSDMEIHDLCRKHPVLRPFELHQQEWMASGKVQKMLELLRKFMAAGHRTLLFSQFKMVMDILELVLDHESINYFRLDGDTKVSERQGLIDEFCDEGNDTPVFMLSTKAGGAGINLAKANKVIVFDSGFNPQDDIQAENRAHRIGQTREVEVIRLVTRGTVEEQIYAMGLTKLKLDEQVAGDGDGDGGDAATEKDDEKIEAEGEKAVVEMFWKKLEDGKDMSPRAGDVSEETKGEEEKEDEEGEEEGEGGDESGTERAVRAKERKQSVELPSRTRPASSRKTSRVQPGRVDE